MNPLIQVVNEQDEVMGHKLRDDLDLNTDIYRVSALWLTNDQNDVLLAQRSFKKNNAPGKWGPAVAGTVEEGETYETNIYKEAQEEIGLTDYKFNKGPKIFINSSRKYFGQWFMAQVNKPAEYFTVQTDEVEKISWVPFGELIKDVQENPQKYTPNFPRVLALFTPKNNNSLKDKIN